MKLKNTTTNEELMELLIAQGPEAMSEIFITKLTNNINILNPYLYPLKSYILLD